MYFAIITFFHILYVLFFINVYMVVFLFNNVIYEFFCYVYVFFLYDYVSSSCQLALFGYSKGFPCFFLSCKANARV
jgi:hypothetical protein